MNKKVLNCNKKHESVGKQKLLKIEKSHKTSDT